MVRTKTLTRYKKVSHAQIEVDKPDGVQGNGTDQDGNGDRESGVREGLTGTASRLAMLKKTSHFTIGKRTLTSPMEALEYCRSLPIKLRYEAHTQLNQFLLGHIHNTEVVLELSLGDIIRENLHTAAHVSHGQYQVDNRDVIQKVEEDRKRREKAVEHVRKFWGKWTNGMAFATMLIHEFGFRFLTDLNKLVVACEPERALYLLNGELITRLREPRPGRRRARCIFPGDVINTIKVLKGKRHETIWDESALMELNLRFNKLGMLGEPSGDYDSLFQCRESIASTCAKFPTSYQPKAVLFNIQKWRELGITLSADALSPSNPCIMDRLITRSSLKRVSLDMRDCEQNELEKAETSTYQKPKMCQCKQIPTNEIWYSTLEDGYLSDVVGWLTTVELVPKQPEDLCRYHTQKLGNILGLVTTYVNQMELHNRISTLYARKNDIDSIRIDGAYYSWFKHHEIAKTERQMNMLGSLKYMLPKQVEVTSLNGHNVRESSDVSNYGFSTGTGLIVQHENLRQCLMESSAMYRHHQRKFKGQSTGFMYHSYFSPTQQLARRDLKLWRNVCRQRLDGEFRLVTVPLPVIEISATTKIDWCFTHGDLAGIFGDAQSKAVENCLTAYVRSDMEYEADPAHHLSVFVPADQTAWSNASHKAFDHNKTIIGKGLWHDLTRRLDGKAFNDAEKKLNFEWQDVEGGWAIFAPGVPLRIRGCGITQDRKAFAATPIPYVAVTLDAHGKVKPQLENGMSYAEVCTSHRTVTPIFDDNITEGGKYVLPKFPVEIRLPCYNLVEQALLGFAEWDDPMVVREARKLLRMPEEEFDQFYEILLQVAVEQMETIMDEVATRERVYGDKSFYNSVEAGECNDIASDDDGIMLSHKENQLAPRWKGKGVDRGYASVETPSPQTSREPSEVFSSVQMADDTQPGRAPVASMTPESSGTNSPSEAIEATQDDPEPPSKKRKATSTGMKSRKSLKAT